MRPPQIREQGGVLIVTLDDPAAVNDGMAAHIRQPIYQAVLDETAPRVAIDMSPIDYLSSSGVALLIGVKRRVDQVAGQLVLFGLHPDVLELLKSMRLASLFQIAPDQDQALELLPPLPNA